MSTRDPRHDEIGFMIREALRTYVGNKTPSDKTWEEIRASLTTDRDRRQRRRFLWFAPALQAALILLLTVIQGVGPTYGPQPPLVVGTPAQEATVQTAENGMQVVRRNSVPYAVTDADVRLLRQLATSPGNKAPTVGRVASTRVPVAKRNLVVDAEVVRTIEEQPVPYEMTVDRDTGLPQ